MDNPHDTFTPPGCLYVVATPIGNLKDITLRALEVLQGVDLVASEDTRRTGRLLSHHGIHTPLVSFHEHNERQRSLQLVEKLKLGLSVALVCDAGTPSVSDPGFRLVRAALDQQIHLIPIPGVSAAITALSVSGLATDSFIFVGFVSKKVPKRRKQLSTLAREPRTLIFYESPVRIVGLVTELIEILGDRPAVLGREMTKQFEEFIRARLSIMQDTLTKRSRIKGECTLLVAGVAEPAEESIDLTAAIQEALSAGDATASQIAQRLAKASGIARRTVYEAVLKAQKKARGSGG
jgi:16S rRNA (cytidine1402-2'-O)-methyltransferase